MNYMVLPSGPAFPWTIASPSPILFFTGFWNFLFIFHEEYVLKMQQVSSKLQLSSTIYKPIAESCILSWHLFTFGIYLHLFTLANRKLSSVSCCVVSMKREAIFQNICDMWLLVE